MPNQPYDLESTFRAIQGSPKVYYPPGAELNFSNNPLRTAYPSPALSRTGLGRDMGMYKSASNGIIYSQPQFFSPVYTPINWQIPSKRREIYQWCRFYYENEPKVASSIDFYSAFPINGFNHECSNREIKDYFDEYREKLELDRWLKVISHERHLLGDCFPFLEISCETCGDSGVGEDGKACDHKGGEFKRLVILNPEYVEVYTSPITPDPVICLIPDDELRNLVTKKGPGYEKLSPRVRALIASGMPIPLDNKCISHLKYGETGYNRYGVSMVRRLFPTLAYKTKLMTAQWIVAERMILPIKVVKVGNDDRPASAADIANVQSQLAATANDPNLTLVTHHAFDLDWYGASSKVLTLSNEFELIAQEELDGLMINKALLNGEGPTYSNAAIGVEVMIHRLEQWRDELSRWIEQHIYLPIAKMKGFVEKDEFGHPKYVYPRIKWNIMHLRDQQNYRQFMLQLYEKGVISTKRLLDAFDIDYDEEIEILNYERATGAFGGQQMGMGGGMGGMGGGFGGGGGGAPGGDMGMGGGGPMGDTGMPGGGGADMGMGGGAPGGGAPAGGAPGAMASSNTTNIGQFGNRVLKKKTRDKLQREIDQQQSAQQAQQAATTDISEAKTVDVQGRKLYTSIELSLLRELVKARQQGSIKHAIVPHFRPTEKFGPQPIELDFAIPDVKVGIEADGVLYHSTLQQQKDDDERDAKLAQAGWTILRFTDHEIESRLRGCIDTIIKTVAQKEKWLKDQVKDKK